MTKENKIIEEKMDTIIGQGAEMEGTISVLGSARVDGRFKGTLRVQGALIVGKTGVIDGEISAKNGVIGGVIKGKLHIEEKVVFESTARFNGELTCKAIVIEEGVVFDGNCSMSSKPSHKEEPK
ncbi:MAG: polymer-forming cytoskeletal protein [candidate division WOR-3 bacterium]